MIRSRFWICPDCDRVHSRSLPHCPGCGHEQPWRFGIPLVLLVSLLSWAVILLTTSLLLDLRPPRADDPAAAHLARSADRGDDAPDRPH